MLIKKVKIVGNFFTVRYSMSFILNFLLYLQYLIKGL